MAAFPAFFCLLLAVMVTGQRVEVTPETAIQRVGDNVTMLCKVPYPINSCRIMIGRDTYIMNPMDNIPSDIKYSGQGFQFGECGAYIKNIKEQWNGKISCLLPPQTGNVEITGIMRLVVAKAPAEPALLSPPQPTFKEGDVFMAQCIVADGRPAARINWYLDDEQITSGIHKPVVTSEPGSDLETIKQNISITMKADHGGRMLICRSEHEALDEPRQVKRQLVVHYPPKRLESGTITVFGLKLGAEGKLNVTVRANPPPQAEWTLGDMKILAPHQTDDGRMAALLPQHLGDGYYNVTLAIARIDKDDVDRIYYLSVYNDLGKEDLVVRMSTMDEPAGVELGTGAIVGIVVAVLILLIAIFLAVFAFATDRWCFAGRSHRTDIPDGADSEAPLPPHDDIKGSENPSHEHGEYISNGRGRDRTKNSGESTPAGDVLIGSGIPLEATTSDTESAVGGKERSRLAAFGARMRSVLPKAKDKVQATETQADTEEKPLSDDKKGVVYAELVLGEQTTADKPPPPSTEYAEIVYTDQTKEVKE
ncbi:hypothetical protein K1T71_000883 [Dendrolimus kikuchii]|uniref:Uncharacterized protein n=1 Tax=Dendrolimus kikuchii TaxID=765133 RepID=A0ACC1DH13_9NEOP|nr:hypothetical protein K1T71_000883 [Dendrolimus kikuchii]